MLPDSMAGRTTARGYGIKHQRLREKWKLKVDRGGVTCWRCGELITAGEPWDLGHDDRDRAVTRGPEHAACNRATASHQPARERPTGSHPGLIDDPRDAGVGEAPPARRNF